MVKFIHCKCFKCGELGHFASECRSNKVLKYFSDIYDDLSVKEMVKNLPPLELPPPSSHIIVETDGCLTGWGAILKWTNDGIKEHIAQYASGKYKTNVSTMDAEILACIFGLEKFKLFLIDQQNFTLRTDCEAIVKFFKNIKGNKINQNRWLMFKDFVIGNGYKVNIEHISGKNNIAADLLSRSLLD